MSMNFAREQSLLRQRLQAVGSPERAAARRAELGSAATFLGADDAAVRQAASDLAAAFPQMGRAQMTAFVRTLWQSRIHELRAVGIELLAARAALLEPADLPFLETLLRDCDARPLADQLGGEVLGAMVEKHKKLWKDLRRLAAASAALLRRAAVLACRRPLQQDREAFTRFAELAGPLYTAADAELVPALDEVLAAAAAVHADAVRAFAAQHGRAVVIPPPPAAPAAPAAPPAAAAPAAPAAPAVSAAAAPAAKPARRASRPAGKADRRATGKPAAKPARKPTAKPAARAAAKPKRPARGAAAKASTGRRKPAGKRR